jgi:hypothetical protein
MKEDIKIIYRIWATWRLERMTPHTDALTQHFQVLEGGAPSYQTRRCCELALALIVLSDCPPDQALP